MTFSLDSDTAPGEGQWVNLKFGGGPRRSWTRSVSARHPGAGSRIELPARRPLLCGRRNLMSPNRAGVANPVPASAGTARPSTFAALKGRNYRLYWLGLVFYVLGHRAEYVTFAWLTWEVTHDPMYLGYLGLAQGVPLVVFQLFGGVLADRVNRLRLLLGTQILTAATLTIAFALTVLGLVRVPHLLALAALSNTFRAFDEPTRLSLVPQLVERERLANAIALGSIPWQAGRMIGPSITGILIAAFGGAVGLGLAAVASCTALVLYSRLRLSGETRVHDGRHVGQQFAEGLSFVGHIFVFASLIALALFNSLFAMSYLTLLPIYADSYFHSGPTG